MPFRFSPALLVLLLLPAPVPSAPPHPRQVRDLVEQLDDDDFYTRERAETALRKLGEDAVPQLGKELDAATSEEVRKRLGRVLLAIDPVGPKVRQIVPWLDDDDFQTRERASADLLRLGERALPFLRRELPKSVSNEEIRKRLKKVIEQLER